MSISNPDDAEVYIGSVLENIDAAVLAAITDVVNGVKTNENYLGTLANGGVGFAYTDVPAELQAEVEAIAQAIADGSLEL
jgi:basic membrane lipoprotein Med (substrate-binding protein (PBP1-ABC) superfamily)